MFMFSISAKLENANIAHVRMWFCVSSFFHLCTNMTGIMSYCSNQDLTFPFGLTQILRMAEKCMIFVTSQNKAIFYNNEK